MITTHRYIKEKSNLRRLSESSSKEALHDFLIADDATSGESLPPLDAALAKKLLERIENIPLFAHAYAFHLNFRLGEYSPWDLLDFAKENDLAGIMININYGGEVGLGAMEYAEHRLFGERARNMGLRIHLENSSTTPPNMVRATKIAHLMEAESVRSYPRYEGKVSELIAKTVRDLKKTTELDPEGKLHYFLEQHEDLKSHELVEIIEKVGNPRLSLLFDFGNMVNANETPDDALTIMAPYVREVHIKDIDIITDHRGGWEQHGCKSGTGDINMPLMMFRLLLLGDDEPQIRAFGLEEEIGYFAPAFRFSDEGVDPFIPFREASESKTDSNSTLEDRLAHEREDAVEQVAFIRDILAQIHSLATNIINE